MKFLLNFASSLAICLSILTLGACSSSSTPTVTPPDETGQSLQTRLQKIVDDAVDSGLPGVSLHVQTGDESISVVAGVANRETAEPVTSATLFHAASAGKTFVAALILRLVDMGDLRLDDPIALWLVPEMSALIADSDVITVEMLLAHTSGIGDYFNNQEYFGDFIESPGRIWTPLEDLAYINNTQNQFAPGSQYEYSNTNFLLLGVIAERVTGVSLGMALRQWVFEPTGLENTYGAYEMLGQPEIARTYVRSIFLAQSDLDVEVPADGSDLDTFAWVNSEGLGDAPVHSTPADMNAFIRTLLGTDTLLSEALRTRMMTESFPGQSGHGLGLFILDGGPEFQHGGKAFGMHTVMAYVPSADVSFATMVNASFDDYDDLYNQYLEAVYRVFQGNE